MRILPIFLPVQFRLASLPVFDEFADENPSFRPVSPWMNRSAVEIQTVDAVRLYGGNAVWKDVAQRFLDDTCKRRTGRLEEDGCWPAFDVT